MLLIHTLSWIKSRSADVGLEAMAVLAYTSGVDHFGGNNLLDRSRL